MAPEHPDVVRLAAGTEHEQQVHDYVNRALTESVEDRGAADKPKTGVPLGRTVTNPVTGEQIPMFVADYVLMEYGTGAIMARARPRPARLRLRDGVRPADPPGGRAGRRRGARGRGVRGAHRRRAADQLRASSPAWTPSRASEAIVAWLDREGMGHASVNYRLRDWLVSRQRYWGCPIPIIYCDELRDGAGARGRPAGAAARRRGLPAQGPLAAGRRRGLGQRQCPSCGGPARRETDTMDTFVDSSWYFLRYCDARNDEAAVGPRGAGPRGCRSTSTSAGSSTRSCT